MVRHIVGVCREHVLLMKKGEISEAFNRVEKLISQQTSQAQPDMYARYVFDNA